MTVAAFIADLSVTMVRSLTRLKVSAGPVSPVEGALGRGGGGDKVRQRQHWEKGSRQQEYRDMKRCFL